MTIRHDDFKPSPAPERVLEIADAHGRRIRVLDDHGLRTIIQCTGFAGFTAAVGVGFEPGSEDLARLIEVLTALNSPDQLLAPTVA